MGFSPKTWITILLSVALTLGIEHGSGRVYTHYFPRPPAEHVITVCFTPGADCTKEIADAIDMAQREVLVQAFGFTSEPILDALVRARDRHVTVRIILDKTNVRDERYRGDDRLRRHGIETYIDSTVAIAHNKLVIIDGRHVVGGSFNFTKAAQKRNAENVTFIWNAPRIAVQFAENWEERRLASYRLK